MYSLIGESHLADEKKEEAVTEEKPFLTPQDFMDILK
jgi:hypothetical protein